MSLFTKSISSFAQESFAQLTKDAVLDGDMVVFSHLRWEFVTQRPQHIMSRLQNKTKILFVEEPVAGTADQFGQAKTFSPLPNVTVLQPYIHSIGDGRALADVVETYAKKLGFSLHYAWFYSAAFVDVLRFLPVDVVIYDCMDELTKFKDAPTSLIEQEQRLLEKADVVFTGGKSLYESKKEKHHNVFCFPSSVDKKHFALAKHQTLQKPEDLKRIEGPIVGFYGVIDERIDYSLLETVVNRLPQLSFVMIGPVVKVDPTSLPKASNLWYLGNKSYEELPAYLSYFDAAMMPFAKNESTTFISPTKTLEFLAAGKPVVSTRITDVVRDYHDVVALAGTPEEFAFRLVGLLNQGVEDAQKRRQRSEWIVNETSWDKTVKLMTQHIAKAQEKKNTSETTIPAYGAFPSFASSMDVLSQ